MPSSSSSPSRPRPCFQHMSMVDWSKLPYDLIALVANKLRAVRDFLSFSAVCHSWRLIYLNKNWTPGPWLMLNEKYADEVSGRYFLGICMNKAYEIPLCKTHCRHYWGSSYGWVVTMDDDFVISLLNPVTRVCFYLPPHPTLGNLGHTNIYWLDIINEAYVFKIGDGFVIMVIYGHYRGLAFARPGDKVWTRVRNQGGYSVFNVACFEGKIYAISFVGLLFHVNIDGTDPLRYEPIATPPKGENCWRQIQLAESSGDLLMILQYDINGQGGNLKFKLYKFDFKATEWTRVDNLGDRALFMDDSYSFSISARDGNDLVPNSIYFVRDKLVWLRSEQRYCGVYHIEDETLETFSLNIVGDYSRLMWFVPTL